MTGCVYILKPKDARVASSTVSFPILRVHDNKGTKITPIY
jgi:hypothetical protein